MKEEEKSPVARLEEALDSQIDYFAAEYDLSLAEAIGCLESVKFRLFREVYEKNEGET